MNPIDQHNEYSKELRELMTEWDLSGQVHRAKLEFFSMRVNQQIDEGKLTGKKLDANLELLEAFKWFSEFSSKCIKELNRQSQVMRTKDEIIRLTQ